MGKGPVQLLGDTNHKDGRIRGSRIIFGGRTIVVKVQFNFVAVSSLN